jgi:archaetidylinositol phosphate synthase
MVLDKQRARGEAVLGPLADRLAPLGADRISWISVGLAGAAGVSFALASAASAWLLILGGLLVFVSGVFDGLDGLVARRAGTASKAGDFLDHALDRYGDLFIIGGLAFSAFGNLRWGFFALTGVFLTSYIATQASAVGLKRDYRGVLGRVDRLVLLTAVPLLQGVLVVAGLSVTFAVNVPWRPPYSAPQIITPITALLLAFAVLGHATAVQRFVRSRRALLRRDGKPGELVP